MKAPLWKDEKLKRNICEIIVAQPINKHGDTTDIELMIEEIISIVSKAIFRDLSTAKIDAKDYNILKKKYVKEKGK